jgi:hypothetical protein
MSLFFKSQGAAGASGTTYDIMVKFCLLDLFLDHKVGGNFERITAGITLDD